MKFVVTLHDDTEEEVIGTYLEVENDVLSILKRTEEDEGICVAVFAKGYWAYVKAEGENG